ncbi:hypothetical protein EZV62_006652 [Acer yangbiense]|uniref:Uncharacterized protein n=1 Tax=Acer yangbiense TaxID=1000413 RepID=A0A5C7I8B1_9ROSI|nr:hypothetical protein EZV62_006652 [Acer yangbiense]
MKFLQPLNLFKESLKREASKRNQLLGLNVGDRFLTLAVSDPENISAVPLRVWPTVLYDKASVADTIQTLIPKHNLMGLVVFSPNISSKSCPIYSYIGGLHKTGKLEGLMYTCWDVNFTSKVRVCHVEFVSNHHVEFIKSLSLPKHLSEKCIEQFAAWHMLQGYLDYSNILVAIDKDIDADLFGGD